MTYEDAMAEAFPAVDAGIQPFGSRVLIQIRTPKKKSSGGIIIDIHGSNETEKWNTQIGKVVALGPLAFKNRDSMTTWPEGEWCKAGEYVRVSEDSWHKRFCNVCYFQRLGYYWAGNWRPFSNPSIHLKGDELWLKL